MYLFITTQPGPAGYTATAERVARKIITTGSTPEAAARNCALHYYFGPGSIPSSGPRLILVETCKAQFMARLKSPTE